MNTHTSQSLKRHSRIVDTQEQIDDLGTRLLVALSYLNAIGAERPNFADEIETLANNIRYCSIIAINDPDDLDAPEEDSL